MNLLSCVVVVLVSLLGARAQLNLRIPPCDSLEAEEVAQVALDYLNHQHSHFYKYALNRIEHIKVVSQPNGDQTYVMELDLLETGCPVMDPTPLVNCTVRPKMLTAVEGDCDVVVKKAGGALSVTAFKCKTEESREDLCLGCPMLLPLNHTNALELVQASLATFNLRNENLTFTVVEVGRMTSQVVSGGPTYVAEYVIGESNCTADVCVDLPEGMRSYGFCSARGSPAVHQVDCHMYNPQVHEAPVNGTGSVAPSSPVVQARTAGALPNLGLGHHKLTAMHNPEQSGFLSAESVESAEVVPVVPAADPNAPVADPNAPTAEPNAPAADAAPGDAVMGGVSSASPEVLKLSKREVFANVPNAMPLVPICPGRVRFF